MKNRSYKQRLRSCAVDGECVVEGCGNPIEKLGDGRHCAKCRGRLKRLKKGTGRLALGDSAQKYANPFDRVLQVGREYHMQDTGNEKEYFRKLSRYVQALRNWRDWSYERAQKRRGRKTVPTPGDSAGRGTSA